MIWTGYIYKYVSKYKEDARDKRGPRKLLIKRVYKISQYKITKKNWKTRDNERPTYIHKRFTHNDELPRGILFLPSYRSPIL